MQITNSNVSTCPDWSCWGRCTAKIAFKSLMYREWLLMQRNMFVYVFKAVQA